MSKNTTIFHHDRPEPDAGLTVRSSKYSSGGWQRGQLVRSLAGRDKGQYYLVLDQADGFLLVADGRKRPVTAPKRKNPLHLQGTRQVAADLGAASQGHAPTNEEIRAAIAELLSCERVKEGD